MFAACCWPHTCRSDHHSSPQQHGFPSMPRYLRWSVFPAPVQSSTPCPYNGCRSEWLFLRFVVFLKSNRKSNCSVSNQISASQIILQKWFPIMTGICPSLKCQPVTATGIHLFNNLVTIMQYISLSNSQTFHECKLKQWHRHACWTSGKNTLDLRWHKCHGTLVSGHASIDTPCALSTCLC